jgi:hypothetical protein
VVGDDVEKAPEGVNTPLLIPVSLFPGVFVKPFFGCGSGHFL